MDTSHISNRSARPTRASERPARRAPRAILALVAVFALFASTPAGATSDEPSSYPTWAEVEAAKQSASATAATHERLEAALRETQSEAAAISTAAVEAAIALGEAEQDLELATEREHTISTRLGEAEAELGDNREALGRTVAWLYRDGSGLARYSELASAESADEFMAKLSIATQVTSTWNTLTEQSTAQVNTIAGLREQAKEARAERESLAKSAREAADAAAEAHTRAEDAVQTAEARSETVYAQLASLRGTTAEVERQYQLGIQVAAQAEAREQERREEAARESARQNEGGPSGGGSAGSGSAPPPSPPSSGTPGIIVDPAAAQAYARSAIGAYGWGGDQFSCLVDLWHGESGWRVNATNPWSGAYGIPQSWPAEKLAAAGPDWRTNAATQINWGLAYIDAAYGSPCAAYSRWLSRNPHWY